MLPTHTKSLKKIQAECDRQDRKFGVRSQHPLVWMSILSEEVGEVFKEINDADFDENKIKHEQYVTELVQCAAVICQAIKNANLTHYAKEILEVKAKSNDNISL